MLIMAEWMRDLWMKKPVEVFATSTDVIDFLDHSDSFLPPLWPDDKFYVETLRAGPNAEQQLRLQWLLVYLHHPDPDVVVAVLRNYMTPKIMGREAFGVAAADLLLHPDVNIQKATMEAIKLGGATLWNFVQGFAREASRKRWSSEVQAI